MSSETGPTIDMRIVFQKYLEIGKSLIRNSRKCLDTSSTFNFYVLFVVPVIEAKSFKHSTEFIYVQFLRRPTFQTCNGGFSRSLVLQELSY